jgi:type I restriction enzyme S subunit
MKSNTWHEARIGDLGNVFTGRTPSTENPAYFGMDFPFITPGDMHQGKYVRKTQRSLSPEGAALLARIKVPADSICVSCIGWQMGEVIMTSMPSFTNQQLNSIVPNSTVDPSFLYYALRPRKQELLSLGAGTGVRTPILNKSAFCNLKVKLPSLTIQLRIAAILSAYDELIENNQRRIRILEDLARKIYREWCVDFRFPGHEKLPRVPSPLGDIPKGWEIKRLKDVAAVTYGFPFQSKKFNTASVGTPVIRIRDILDGSTNTFTDEIAEPKHHIKNGDILVGMDGDFHMCMWSSGHAFQNQRVAKFESQGEIGNYHLFLALELPIQTWNKSIVGTTVAHLGDMHIKTIQLAWPPAQLLAEVKKTLEPMSEQIIMLKRQIQNLRQTRDLLLPRLLSGQIELSEIEIKERIAA